MLKTRLINPPFCKVYTVQLHPILGAFAPYIPCIRDQYTSHSRPIYLAFATNIPRKCEVYWSRMDALSLKFEPLIKGLGRRLLCRLLYGESLP